MCNKIEFVSRNVSKESDVSELGHVVPGEEEKCHHPSLRERVCLWLLSLAQVAASCRFGAKGGSY